MTKANLLKLRLFGKDPGPCDNRDLNYVLTIRVLFSEAKVNLRKICLYDKNPEPRADRAYRVLKLRLHGFLLYRVA